jgi:ferredoxin, 2Fe-2S
VTVTARKGDTLLDAALDNGVLMPHECGGNCSCTTCHVVVLEGGDRLSPTEEPEDERLDTTDYRTKDSRLGCQALLKGGHVTVRLVEEEDKRFRV